MSTSRLELNCLILGDDSGRIFTVKTDSVEMVRSLRPQACDIRQKNIFRNVDADADTQLLWKASIAVDDNMKPMSIIWSKQMRWSHSRFYRRSFQTDYKMTISILSYMPVSASDNTSCVVPQLIYSQHSNSTVLLSIIPISMTSLRWTSRRSKTSSVLGKLSKLRKSMRSTTLTPTPLNYGVFVSRWQWSQAENHRFQLRRQKFVSSYS